MKERDRIDHMKRWIRIMNKGAGYAGVFNYENSDDKRVVETSTVGEWQRSMAEQYGVYTATPKHNPNDPPDFHAQVANKTLSVELVQLFEQEHKMRAAKGESPYSGQLFSDMQWSRERFTSKITETICKKGEKYKKAGVKIDVLLIHTAEPWLKSIEARQWLDCTKIETHSSIDAVHLLFEYEPDPSVDHWPLLTIYGDLPI